MTPKIGQYVLWENELKLLGHRFPQGTINKIVDIDYDAKRVYFNHIDSATPFEISLKGELFDTQIEASEAAEELLHPSSKKADTSPASKSWMEAIGSGLVSREGIPDTTGPVVPDIRPSYTTKESFWYGEDSCVTFYVDGESYSYTVKDDFLSYDDGDDDTILYVLGFHTSSSQGAFCQGHYGYKPVLNSTDEFPTYRVDDYKAAEDVIRAIKSLCKDKDRERKATNALNKSRVRLKADLRGAIMGSGFTTSSHLDKSRIEEKFAYTPVYGIHTKVEFDTGKVSYIYTVQSHYMTCMSGWDAIYKELGVNPASFIREATGKDAIYHSGPYGISSHDMVSSDKLINALLRECATLRGTVRFVDARSGDHVSPLADPVPSFEDVLESLEVQTLEIN